MKALVTGGGGFLGNAMVTVLMKRKYDVRTIQRGDYPFLQTAGAEVIKGDLRIDTHIDRAVQGCDIVFHVAAKVGVWGNYNEYYQANVSATQNVIDACKRNNVRYLVYTSTPSVVFDGKDEVGIDESTPYSKYFFNAYQKTKAEAEQRILQANGKVLKTVALRPHLLWGPGDKNFFPRIIQRARAGQLKRVGDGQNKVDACYIDNAVLAHVLAADELMGTAKCAGKAYFISNDEPIPIQDLVDKMLLIAGLNPVSRKISAKKVYGVGALLELIYTVFRIQNEPIMTRFIAKQLSTSHWFDLSAAKADFDYKPAVTTDEGMKRLAESLQR